MALSAVNSGAKFLFSTPAMGTVSTSKAEQSSAAVTAASVGLPAGGAGSITSSGLTQLGWESSGSRANIVVGGVVVGRVYNSGAVELSNEYASMTDKLGWGGELEQLLDGPALASKRMTDLTAVFGQGNVKFEMLSTAMDQDEWDDYKSSPKSSRIDRYA